MNIQEYKNLQPGDIVKISEYFSYCNGIHTVQALQGLELKVIEHDDDGDLLVLSLIESNLTYYITATVDYPNHVQVDLVRKAKQKITADNYEQLVDNVIIPKDNIPLVELYYKQMVVLIDYFKQNHIHINRWNYCGKDIINAIEKK